MFSVCAECRALLAAREQNENKARQLLAEVLENRVFCSESMDINSALEEEIRNFLADVTNGEKNDLLP